MTTIYSIKWLWSEGIQEYTPERIENKIVYVKVSHGNIYFELGKDCFLTRKEAVDGALRMLTKKRNSLSKQWENIERLEALLMQELDLDQYEIIGSESK